MGEAARHAAEVAVYAMRGPAHPDKLEGKRITTGVFADGEKFVLEDGWREPGLAHRVLNKPWTGTTKFRIRKICWADE